MVVESGSDIVPLSGKYEYEYIPLHTAHNYTTLVYLHSLLHIFTFPIFRLCLKKQIIERAGLGERSTQFIIGRQLKVIGPNKSYIHGCYKTFTKINIK